MEYLLDRYHRGYNLWPETFLYRNDLDRLRRATQIVCHQYAKVMRIMITSEMAASKLRNIIKNNEHGFNEIISKKERIILQDLSTTTELSTLYKVISFFNLVEKPTSGRWGIPPKSKIHMTRGDDVERMLMRQKLLFHYPSTQMIESQFDDFYDEFMDIAVRIEYYYGIDITHLDNMYELMSKLFISQFDMYAKYGRIGLYLKEQIRDHTCNVRYFFGDDIETLQKGTNGTNIDEYVFLNAYLHNVHGDFNIFDDITGKLDWLDGSPIMAWKYIHFNVCARRKIFASSHMFIEHILYFFRSFSNTHIVISTDTTVDDHFKKSTNRLKIQEKTIPKLEEIQSNLSKATKKVKDFRKTRNFAVLGILFLLLFYFFSDKSLLGMICLNAASLFAGIFILSVVVERHFTLDVMRTARLQLVQDRIDAQYEPASFYMEQRIKWIQEALSTKSKEIFLGTINNFNTLNFWIFIKSFINIEAGSIFYARDKVKQLLNDIQDKMQFFERMESHPSRNSMYGYSVKL